MFLKKNNSKYLLIILFFFLKTNIVSSEDIGKKIQNITYDYNNLSVSFIQINDLEESNGIIFVGKDRVKIEYFQPSKITIVISEKKSMYYNKDLSEVQYFDTKKSEVNVFFKILKKKNFLSDAVLKEANGNIVILEKKIEGDNNYMLNLIFEKNPYKLRKINLKNENINYSISLFNYNFNENLEKNIFSLVNPLIIN